MRDRRQSPERQESLSSEGDHTDARRTAPPNSRRSLDADGGLRIGEFLDALANRRRRYLLYILRNEKRSTLDDIAKRIAAQEQETSSAAGDLQTYTNVRINLYHSQLPKLEEAGFVTYDRQDESVRYHCPPEPIGELLDYFASVEWSEVAER